MAPKHQKSPISTFLMQIRCRFSAHFSWVRKRIFNNHISILVRNKIYNKENLFVKPKRINKADL